MKRKTGLLFGSFNPVHVGHCIIAQSIAQSGLVDEVWFVLTPQNPLKNKKNLLGDTHRLALLRLIEEDSPHLKACDIELKLSPPYYTINTLVHLEEKYPNKSFYLIIGSDNLATLHKWKNYEALLANYKLIAYPRPGYDGGEFTHHPNVIWAKDLPLMQISSTYIREQIKKGKDVKYLLPDKVYNYVDEMNFYK